MELTKELTNPFFTHGIDKLCTICHAILKDDNTHSIHSTIEKLQSKSPLNVIQVLRSFSNFNIYYGPQMVCTTCYEKTIEVYEFIEMCNKAHENIQNYLKYQEDMKSKNQAIIKETMETRTPEVEMKTEEMSISDTQVSLPGACYPEQTNFYFAETEIKLEEDIKEESISETEDNLNVDIMDESGVSTRLNFLESDHQPKTSKLLPTKSQVKYQLTYDRFVKWRKAYRTKSCSEAVMMAYFKELSSKYKSSTLWTIYSMLHATLNMKENKDISTYQKLNSFLKGLSVGYVPKKSMVFSSCDVKKFLKDAPDKKYLLTKVALIIGISGACRREELWRLKLDDVKDLDSVYEITIPDTKTNKSRTFTVGGHFYDYCKKYTLLRPTKLTENRFFVNYHNGVCIQQFVGINKFGSMAKEIATYLGLPNPELYTGHCFRRSSSIPQLATKWT